VYLIGLTDADREKVEEMLDKQLVRFPVGMESDSHEEYEINSYPRMVVIDPTGRVRWSGWPADLGALREEVSKIHEEYPPVRTHPEEEEKVYRHLKEAREHLRAGRYRAAHDAASDAHESALTGDPLKMRCQNMLDLIDAVGRDLIAQAERAVDERRLEDAADLLQTVTQEFSQLAVARRAGKRLDELAEKHDKVKDWRTAGKEETIAGNILYRAKEAMFAREFGEAFDQLEEILDEYPDTEAAGMAETVIERMRKHDGVWGRVRDHLAEDECSVLLSRARAYMELDRYADARELLEKITADHPRTIWDDEARRLLIEIRTR
jgi:tetratricopeptide (TPR) repeat protein